MNALKHFMTVASGAEQEELASSAGTSRAYLYRLANTETAYARTAKAELAAALEAKTQEMAKASKGRLPVVYRTDLNAACRACPYAQRCLGARATASQFEILGTDTGEE
jgi:hypothetical protein